MAGEWASRFLQPLREMSDVSAQQRACIDGDLPSFPDPVELVCQVFDDSGVDDALAAGTVFSPEADDLLRQLNEAVEAADVSGQADRWINERPWTLVADLARRALLAISKVSADSPV